MDQLRLRFHEFKRVNYAVDSCWICGQVTTEPMCRSCIDATRCAPRSFFDLSPSSVERAVWRTLQAELRVLQTWLDTRVPDALHHATRVLFWEHQIEKSTNEYDNDDIHRVIIANAQLWLMAKEAD